MKVCKLFENQGEINYQAADLLKQGKACYHYDVDQYDYMSISIWSDIPATITEQQVHQLLDMSGLRQSDLVYGKKRIFVDIESSNNWKTEIIDRLEDHATFKRNILEIYTFAQWAEIAKETLGYYDQNDFED